MKYLKNASEQDASAQLLALLDAAVDAIISIDHQGNIALFNKSAEKLFGYKKEQIIGKNVTCLMPDSYRKNHDNILSNYLKTKQAKIIGSGRKLQALKSDGSQFPIYLSVGEVKTDEHPWFVGIIRDLTEREKNKLEALVARNKQSHMARLNSLGEMTAGIAHEINQPLSAISSYTQASKRLLAHKPLQTEKLKETLDKIEQQAVRASDVINHLRGFVKKRIAKRENVDLHELIMDTLNLAKFDTRIQDHEVALSLCNDKPPIVLADPIQIQQVLLNLIRNAIDAMEDLLGEGLIIKTQWINGDAIQVSVADHGHGVDKAVLTDLFKPFTTTKEEGMGMGLSISEGIIHAHGGTMAYQPNEGSGSIFSFSLPASELS